MSNCITLYNHIVVFNNDEIDIAKLFDIIQALPLEVGSFPKTAEETHQYYCWWFLNSLNVKFNKSKPQIFDINEVDQKPKYDSVTVKFGHGRSSHTWRDFRGLLNNVIKPLIKNEKEHIFIVTDEGAPGKFSMPVIFGRIFE